MGEKTVAGLKPSDVDNDPFDGLYRLVRRGAARNVMLVHRISAAMTSDPRSGRGQAPTEGRVLLVSHGHALRLWYQAPQREPHGRMKPKSSRSNESLSASFGIRPVAR